MESTDIDCIVGKLRDIVKAREGLGWENEERSLEVTAKDIEYLRQNCKVLDSSEMQKLYGATPESISVLKEGYDASLRQIEGLSSALEGLRQDLRDKKDCLSAICGTKEAILHVKARIDMYERQRNSLKGYVRLSSGDYAALKN